MIPAPVVDGRRFESFLRELRRFAPHYTPDLNLADEQGVGVALMKICAQLAETIAVRLDQAPQKHFVAFLSQLGINLLPARPARVSVTFRLASGFAEAVSVPSGTRVTAPGEDDDISFETADELVVIPGALKTAYGIDPLKDLIFHHPPGFLNQVPRTPTELNYTIQSFVVAGSTRLQLNHTTELVPDSFILIGENEKAVIQKVDEGGFITLYNPVSQDFTPGTLVLPIRDFEVFNGIDLQEHVLYLGHTGIFTVKEEVEIKLKVTLNVSELQPLDLVWQFWTKDETVIPEQDEHWENLTVVSDGTGSLSSSGEIVLVKKAKLEIKSREIGGRESRWIRAKLLEKLPFGDRTLPEIETIEVGVNTARDSKTGEPKLIPADQGFYNATPLDVQVAAAVGFFPFGNEPRQFDQFYLASKEAFSKRDADVTLDFDLDLQTLAAPSVVQLSSGLRAYAIGLRRRLYELNENGSFNILGSPEPSPFLPLRGSRPSAVVNSKAEILVFVNTEDTLNPQDPENKVWVHVQPSGPTTATWGPLDAPEPTQKKLQFSPAAVLMPNAPDSARVFVVGADGQLYSRLHPVGPAWEAHGSPEGVKLDSPPFVVTSGSSISVFITGNGIVHWLTIENPPVAGTQPKWRSLKPNSTLLFTAMYRPFAQLFTVGAVLSAKVFVFGFLDLNNKTSGKLFECDTRSESNAIFRWNDLGQPTSGEVTNTAPEAHAPNGYLRNVAATDLELEGKHIFLRGVDGRLYERTDQQWQDHSRQGDPDLRDSPAVNIDPPPGSNAPPLDTVKLNVFSASGRNSLARWDFEIRSTRISSNDDNEGVQLDDQASNDHERYKDKDLTITFADNSSETQEIRAYDGDLKLARLKNELNELPDHDSEWEIEVEPGQTDEGNTEDGADKIFVVHDPDNTILPIFVRVNGDFIPLVRYSGRTGLVIDVEVNDLLGIYGRIVGGATEFPSPEDTGTVPELSWEYWNGTGWLSIRDVSDDTRNLLRNGDVKFKVPKDIQSTEVAGQENFWIRARLAGGDYGRETFKIVTTTNPQSQTVVSDKSSLRPPKVRTVGIGYQAAPVSPEICLTFNNLDYLDQTAAAQAPDSRFEPFTTLDEKSFTIFFGFDKPFKTGPVRILLDAAERNFDENRRPELEWFFRRDRLWKKLDAGDDSLALTRQGILTLSASEELTREIRFGESLFWIKGTLRTDRISQAEYPLPLLRGIFPNSVVAFHGQTITDEIAGSGDGEPKQTHTLQHFDVLDNEDIRIRELLSVEEREQIEQENGKDTVTDREDIGGTWVRWKEVAALFDRDAEDRCYEIDRAAGMLRFGDGVHGRTAPAGVDNIRAFKYRTGGGAVGNVAANKIAALATAVAGIESAFNPTPAGGGSDKATTEEMLTIGPRHISHRDRAVSAEDFEELAREASRQVAKVRCLRTTNLQRSGAGAPDPCDPQQRHEALEERGFVSLIIVPDSTDAQPCPSLELRRTLKDYLRQRAPSIVAGGERLVVRPPDYVAVGVQATIIVTSIEKAAAVETTARKAVDKFLHPVTGGPDGTGWEFGRSILKSDVFAELERITDIDRVEGLSFLFRGRTDPERVEIGPNELLASGKHDLKITTA